MTPAGAGHIDTIANASAGEKPDRVNFPDAAPALAAFCA